MSEAGGASTTCINENGDEQKTSDTKIKSKSSKTNNKSSSSVPIFKVEIPRISSRDLHAQRCHQKVTELEQISCVFNGPGAKRDSNKLLVKIKTLEMEECIKKAKKFSMEQSVRFALVKQQQQQQKQQLELIKKQQALLLMCRIYVGSIFYEVKEEAVRTAFGSFGPIRSISMSWDAATNKHKGFAFIEFETPEAAQLALEQMNGCLLGGRNIKVGRPSNMPQAQPIIDQLTEEAKNYNRIYVASVHAELSESDVQSVFEAFGIIKSCTLARDSQTDKHKGYGFIEYETVQSTQDAIASMNLFDLGGQLLRVGKSITPPENPTTQAQTNTILSSATTSGFNIQDLDKINLNTLTSVSQLSQASINPGTPFPTSSFGLNLSSSSLTSVVSTTPSSTNLAAASASQSSTSVQTAQLTPTKSSSTQEIITQPAAAAAAATITTTTTTTTALSKAQLSPQQQDVVSPISGVSGSMLTASQLQQLQQMKVLQQMTAIELTDNQKKLLGMTSTDDPSASLEQQVEMTLKGKEQRLLLMQKLMQRKPDSRVLILRNMVGPEDVDSELENEITDECGKYGNVDRVVIYQEKQGEEENALVIVKIFVEFTSAKSIEKAVEALNGRFFAGRVVKAEIYDQTAYDSKDYSG